jgi:CheY-like chemotaxis protein/anti-sigma regulatory factor (Ser/Thr protein kinase)
MSLRSLLEDVCESLRLQVDQKQIELTYHVGDEVPTYVLGDSVRMRQVLTNLVNNAIKFTSAGGVTVDAKRTLDGRLQLTVEDSGIGMSEQALGALFEPFQQADVATTRRYGGTGLGLSIVKRLVDLMDGTVRCESEEGRGSRFIVVLPFVPWVPSAGSTSRPDRSVDLPGRLANLSDEAGSELIGLRVLLAEDHPVNQEVIIRQLAKLGVSCDCAEDGEQAWERLLLPDAGYAVLLTDCHMPRLDGYELTERIRAREALLGLPRLPIVALTANALRGERERCLQLGMDEYLSKPMQAHELKAALSRVIKFAEASPAGGAATPYPQLIEVCSGDPEVVVKVLNVFIAVTPADIEAMEHAAREADFKRLRLLAHKLGSGCRQLDESRAVSILEAIEGFDEFSTATDAVEIATGLSKQARTELTAVLERASRFVSARVSEAS